MEAVINKNDLYYKQFLTELGDLAYTLNTLNNSSDKL